MAAGFMQWGFVILPKTMDMNEQTKKEIYEIIEQAKILEALMKELELESESALTEKQKNNLAGEEFFIVSALCNAGCISDVISRIDSALHHPEEYL